jgi:hypothetical protein
MVVVSPNQRRDAVPPRTRAVPPRQAVRLAQDEAEAVGLNEDAVAIAASPKRCRDSAYTAAIDQGTGIQVLASRDMPPRG